MNKTDLKRVIAQQENITLVEAEKYINSFIEAVKAGLISDGKVSIQGFMNFEIKKTKPSSGVLNGKEWYKPAGHRVATKISDIFQKEVVEE